MTERNKVDWLPGLIGPLLIRLFGVAAPKLRTTINLEVPGLTATDDSTNEQSTFAINAATFVAAGLAAAADDLDVNEQKVTGLADGEDATDAVNKGQLDGAVELLTEYIDDEIAGVGGGGGGPWDLTSDVAGILPLANGGTNSADYRSATCTFTNKSINATDNPISNLVNACFSNGCELAWSKMGVGTATLPAVTSFVTSVDAKCTLKSREPVHVQTTDATVTTLDSFTLGSETSCTVTWTVTAVKSDGSEMASYSVSAAFKNDGGTVTQIGTTITTVIGESDAAWDATADHGSGAAIRLRVTGKAATTIQWGAVGSSLEVIP